MYLFLDNSAEDKTFFYVVYPDGRKNVFVYKGAKASSGPLICFDDLLKKNRFKLKDIKGLGARIGVGRFTASRIAVIFVNTLGYFLKKPVIGLMKFDSREFLKKIKKTKNGVFLSAKYSGEANVGFANKKV